MERFYTSGSWTAKAGREQEFIDAWEDFASWSAENIEGALWARLVQQRDEPRRFLSFGAWQSAEAIEAWRADPGFNERVGVMRDLLDESEVASFELRASVGIHD